MYLSGIRNLKYLVVGSIELVIFQFDISRLFLSYIEIFKLFNIILLSILLFKNIIIELILLFIIGGILIERENKSLSNAGEINILVRSI